MVDHSLLPPLELKCVGRLPPVLHMTHLVVLRAYVVEAMGHLVADGAGAQHAIIIAVAQRRVDHGSYQAVAWQVYTVEIWRILGIVHPSRHIVAKLNIDGARGTLAQLLPQDNPVAFVQYPQHRLVKGQPVRQALEEEVLIPLLGQAQYEVHGLQLLVSPLTGGI